jgi:hypothetical protein
MAENIHDNDGERKPIDPRLRLFWLFFWHFAEALAGRGRFDVHCVKLGMLLQDLAAGEP